MRHDGRPNDALRPVKVTRGFTQTPGGSVLWQQGNTIVLCTASITNDLPPWMKEDRPGGWVTAEYVMLPASTPQRKPWPRMGHTDSRGTEIQRLIGRSLRAIVDLSRIGPHTVAIDCQVLQADGGTRTAAICGAYIALVDALRKLPAQMPGAWESPREGKPQDGNADSQKPAIPARYDPSFYDPAHAVIDSLAAVSVGIVDGEVRLDLDYHDDSRANVDMNVAYSGSGRFVEIQAAAENGTGFSPEQMQQLLNLATAGCRQLLDIQRQALAE